MTRNFTSVLKHAYFLCITTLMLAGVACGNGNESPQVPDQSLTIGLNDTGRSSCSGDDNAQLECPVIAAPGQDAEYGRDAQAQAGTLIKIGAGDAGFDFSKISANGMPLALQDQAWSSSSEEAEGTQWACVLDNTTQLMWEVKHTDPSHGRYALSTYSWYVADDQRNGGLAGFTNLGECNAGACDTQGYVEYVNEIGLCGYYDWRLPSISEFFSIGHQGRENPAIDESYFPNTLGALRYWSRDGVAEIPQNAWYMYFSDASVSFTNKNNASYIRLVRGGTETSL